MKIGSLFDGSGGFPLAGVMCGIEPVWASEIEPYPIAVTKNRLPNMRHLGDIQKINGANIEPVDVITFGSPCQDLSVAGKRAGLKHEDNGDEETTRSGLFMEAIRIIKEMREATDGRYPKYCVWENVPGAFSSHKGEDFRTVLEELVKIVEPTAVMPQVPKGGWAYADSFCGDGWSLAWRVFDAQYIRTAQRRRRIYLVLCLTDERAARKILFEREGLRGHTPSCGTPRQGTSSDAERSVGADDCKRTCFGIGSYDSNGMKSDNPHSGFYEADTSRTLDVNGGNPACYQGGVAIVEMEQTPFCKSHREQSADDATTWKRADKANTLNNFDTGEARANELVVAIDRAFFNQGQNALYEPQTYEDGTNPTIVAKGPSAVCYGIGNGQVDQTGLHDIPGALNCMHDQQAVLIGVPPHYIVRRLTPTECARLQGFPDHWGHIEPKSEFTDEEYKFWLEVRNTHAAINGRQVKDYAKKQMLTWYNKLWTDSAEYKMWGNGIALPCALYVMQGIADIINN